ncbi:hypothetical protein ACPCHT_33080 [Nucisporomicrobium flavum]|uniref:hypothetical protein n=1 Tax=Nucisporomicrobium flavum TaxID=2785915 RepID=UPI003C2EDD85
MTASESMWTRVVRAADRGGRLSELLTRPEGADRVVAVSLRVPYRGQADAAVLQRATDEVTRVVQDHLTALGLPGRPVVSVTPSATGAEEPYLLRINGRRVRCAGADLPDPTDLPRYAATVCAAAILRRPSILLGAVPIEVFAGELDGGRVGAARLAAALPRVLDQGVSLADREAVRAVLDDAGDALHPAELAEALTAALQSPTVDVRFTRETLRRVTTAQPADRELFSSLRTQFYSEQGVLGPGFRFVVDPDVPERHFAIRINALVLPAIPLRTANPLHEVHDALLAMLRRHASWLVSLTGLMEVLEPLRWALPDTVRAVEKRFSGRWLAAVARALVDEGISVRHPATLLDWLLDLDPTAPPPGWVRLSEGPVAVAAVRSPALLPDPRDAVASLRSRWLEEDARMVPRDGPLPVHRLDAALEAEVAKAAATGPQTAEDVAERVAAAVRRTLPDACGAPLVAPSLRARTWLLDELRAEFPGLRVLAVGEFPPSLELLRLPAGAASGALTTPPRGVAGVW